ncbi:hypothetical protein [Hoylesella timonensis]|uniref:hypothetical protein n=1 Tax=Hoylesella timonensis TaxID=386414 RepID=UPI0035CF93E5
MLLALKFTAGILGGSAAMIADAVHSEPLKVNGCMWSLLLVSVKLPIDLICRMIVVNFEVDCL